MTTSAEQMRSEIETLQASREALLFGELPPDPKECVRLLDVMIRRKEGALRAAEGVSGGAKNGARA